MSIPAALVGSWKLVSITIQLTDTDEAIDLYGPKPKGRAIISADGRVVFLLMRGDRQPDAAKSTLYETMGAYSGTCRFDGNVFTTAVDMASDPSWEGSLRPRSFILEGNKLSLTTSEQRDHPNYPGRPSIGLVVWERET